MWLYKNKKVTSVDQMPTGVVGFVYKITNHNDGKSYIGKKILKFNKTLPPLKGAKRKRRVVKESDWLNYYGSNTNIKTLIKEGKQDLFKREILIYAHSKKQMSYYETKLQFQLEVLEHPDKYYNDNIGGRFFRKDLIS